MAQKDKLSWTAPMDDALVDAFYHQCVDGNKIDGTFTSKAYDNIAKELQQTIHMDISKDQLKNRIKTLKRNYSECYDQMSKVGFSGFSWDPATRRLGAEPEVWDKLIAAYPAAKKWRTTPIPNYERMKEIYGKDRATGIRAATAKEKRKRWASAATNNEDITIEDIDEMVSQNEVTLDGCEGFGSSFNFSPPGSGGVSKLTPTSKKKKSKTSVVNEDRHFGMINAINNMAGVMDKVSQNKVENKENDHRLSNALRDAGFDKKIVPKCVLFLVRNNDVEKAFFQVELDMRKEFLAEEMGLPLDP